MREYEKYVSDWEHNFQKCLDGLEPGDIMLSARLTGPTNKVGEIIRKWTDSKYSHVAIVSEVDKLTGRIKILEAAFGKGVVETDLREYMDGANLVSFRRLQHATPEQRRAMVRIAKRIARDRPQYDAAQLGRIAIGFMSAGGKFDPKKLTQFDKDKFICSEFVLVSARGAGIPFSKTLTRANVTPGGINRSWQTHTISGLTFQPKPRDMKFSMAAGKGVRGKGKGNEFAIFLAYMTEKARKSAQAAAKKRKAKKPPTRRRPGK